MVAARFAVCGFLTVRAKTLCGRPGRSKEYPGRFVEKASDPCFESVPGDAPLSGETSTLDVFNLAESDRDSEQGRI